MTTTICFDFGNTRKKYAVFQNAEIKESFVMSDDNDQTIEALLNNIKPDKTILSSVIDHNPRVDEILASRSKFHRLGVSTKLPFTTPVGKPETIGADRLALAAAAVQYYPRKNNLVIGLGTCITYNFINKYHEFLGGAISPGLEMRLKSLNQFTAKLPHVQADSNLPLIGYDTRTNILSGVILGMAKEIDGIVESYKEKWRNFNVLLTGGDIAYLGYHLKSKIFADPDLIFKGLYGIIKAN